MIQYLKLSDEQKITFLSEKYYEEGMSVSEIARLAKTYPNKIRRDALRLNLPLKNKSDVYKDLHKRGIVVSPTKGRTRTKEEKYKISESRHKAWSSMSKKEREDVRQKHVKNWKNKTEEEKNDFIKTGLSAIRQTQEVGSKLEQFLYKSFLELGFYCEKHCEFVIDNEKMHFDLFLRQKGIVIEVDGPAHSKDIWGNDKLEKTKQSDSHKNSLITRIGLKIIRVSYDKKLYQHIQRKILNRILEIIKNPTDKIYFVKV